MTNHLQHFIALNPLSPQDGDVLLASARGYASAPRQVKPIASGKTLGMIFEKPSTRTMVSFDVAMTQLGGHSIVLNQSTVGLGVRERVKDVSRVLSRYVDAVMIRTFDHDVVSEFAQYSTIPVINGLTDYSHPCQALADVLTIDQHIGLSPAIKVCYIGDVNNVTRSLAHAAEMFKFDLTICSPTNSQEAIPGVYWQSDPKVACQGVHVIYTDTWVSMGQEKNAGSLDHLLPYQVTSELMSIAAENAIFMHCLPAHIGEEVIESVFEGPQSVNPRNSLL